MLQRIYTEVPSEATPLVPPAVTGSPHRSVYPRTQRAFWAADFYARCHPTIRQAAAVAEVSPTYVVMANAVSAHPDLRYEVETGRCSLLDAYQALHPKPTQDAQIEPAYSDNTVASFVRLVGIERVWKALCAIL